MIITRIDEHSIGFIVDTVSEVEDIPAEHVDAAHNFKSELAQHNKYLSGIGRVGEEVKILLDVERLITGEEIEQIAAGA
jgi:purine-binding chemotaxis protein CheW